MLVHVIGPVSAFDDEDQEIVDVARLSQLDGLEYSADLISNYFDSTLSEIGVMGGNLRLSFDQATGRLLVTSEFLSPRKLKPKEVKLLLEETTGQWSDGIGEGDLFELDGIYLDFCPMNAEAGEPRVEQIDDGKPVKKPRKSPLFNLAAKGDVEKLKKKLDEGESPNVRDKDGLTPLHSAILARQTAAALLLIERGADLEAYDGSGGGFCPLTCAAIRGNLEVGQALLDRGVDINQQNIVDDEGYSPLNMACNRNEFAFARMLIEQGADVNIRDRSGYTPLMMLSPDDAEPDELQEMTSLARLLIEQGADPDAINVMDEGMDPALRKELGLE